MEDEDDDFLRGSVGFVAGENITVIQGFRGMFWWRVRVVFGVGRVIFSVGACEGPGLHVA